MKMTASKGLEILKAYDHGKTIRLFRDEKHTKVFKKFQCMGNDLYYTSDGNFHYISKEYDLGKQLSYLRDFFDEDEWEIIDDGNSVISDVKLENDLKLSLAEE